MSLINALLQLTYTTPALITYAGNGDGANENFLPFSGTSGGWSEVHKKGRIISTRRWPRRTFVKEDFIS